MHAILAVILNVAAGQRAAVNVHRVALPVRAALEERFVAHHDADFFREVEVEGSRQNRGASPERAARELQRRFVHARAYNIHRVYGFHAAAVVDEARHFFPRQLVHECFPLLGAFIVALHNFAVFNLQAEVDARHVHNGDGRLFAFGAGRRLRPSGRDAVLIHEPFFIALIHVGAVRILTVQRRQRVIIDFTIRLGRRCGLSQTRRAADHAGKQRVVDGGEIINKQGFNLFAGDVVGGAVHARRHGVGFGQLHIVRVAARGDNVIARFQLIAGVAIGVGVIPVVARHVLRNPVNGHRLRLTGLKQVGLGKADKVRARLFNAALGVRRIGVHLHNFLACHVAGVGDLHLHGQLLEGVGNRGIRRGHQFPVKGRVAQAVAVRIQHLRIVPFVTGAGVFGVHVVRRRLVVLVADIDAFAVLNGGVLGRFAIVIEESIHRVAVFINVLRLVAEVGEGRALGEVAFPNFHGVAAGVDFAGNQLANRLDGIVARVADPENRVHAVFAGRLGFSQFGNLQDVGGVNQNDNRLVRIMLFDVLDQRLLVVVQHQLMVAGVAVVSHIADQLVAALRARAGENDNRRVAIAIVGADGCR